MIANKQMRIVDSKDLRMRFDETCQILQMDLGPPFSGKLARQIHEAAGGWAAGLVLMSQSVRHDTASALNTDTAIPSNSMKRGCP